MSRVITLSSERQGLDRRLRELQVQTESRMDALEEARERRQTTTWDWFVKHALVDCAEHHGNMPPEQLVERHGVRGAWDDDEMLMMASDLNGLMQTAFERLSALGCPPGRLRSTVAQGFEIPEGQERIYRAAIDVIAPARQYPFAIPAMPALLPPALEARRTRPL